LPHCDLLIEGVTLIPSAFEAPVMDARIAITDGRFVAPTPGMMATRRLNLAGHLAVPGLINTHLHSALVMVRGTAEDMGFAPSYTKGVPQAQMLTPMEALLCRTWPSMI
jgi:5-methylthioadenosine/S-adenosylhomocysteine deaminase